MTRDAHGETAIDVPLRRFIGSVREGHDVEEGGVP